MGTVIVYQGSAYVFMDLDALAAVTSFLTDWHHNAQNFRVVPMRAMERKR